MPDRAAYLSALSDRMWQYAGAASPSIVGDLDHSERRGDRPPVFRHAVIAGNVLCPPDAGEEVRQRILATMPVTERHRHFGSMRSSQALAQSVFGSLVALGAVESLCGLRDERGLPAFPDTLAHADVTLEKAVGWLGEPRPTSIDVWIEGDWRIAVECKLTEAEFGTCSRPRLVEGRDRNYARDHCDGSFSRQRGRSSRCSLSEIGVTYWDHIPELFAWQSSKDMRPCPLAGPYQLVRNVLAACVGPDGSLAAESGYALVIYDKRNPAFAQGGIADRQWSEAEGALRRPECLRRCSWQSLAAHLAKDRSLEWLVSALDDKYGIVPDEATRRS